jgi:hypothetical protein
MRRKVVIFAIGALIGLGINGHFHGGESMQMPAQEVTR